MSEETLSNLLKEDRRFEPPAELAEHANLKEEAYERAAADREAFWAEQAERLDWDQKWDRVLDWDDPPFAKWFVGGRLNAAYNCVDRHVEAGLGDRVAIHWVGEPDDDTRTLTYADLKDEVSRAANALTDLGVEAGDRVAIYMPMIPEARGRDAGLRPDRRPAHRGVRRLLRRRARRPGSSTARPRWSSPPTAATGAASASALKPAVDEARAKAADEGVDVETVLVVERTGQDVEWDDDVDVWWHDVVDKASTEHEPRGLRLRAPALRHVHLRHDRQAQGHPAHDRRLPDRLRVHALGGLRPQAGDRRLLVHRRRRLGDRPQLHGLRPAGQRRHPGPLRGHARTAPRRAAGGRSSRSTASRSSTPRRPRSGRS